MSPGEPQVRSATPAIPFGVRPAESKEFVLDFHGYLLLPAQLGEHQRPNPTVGQSSTVLHSPPLMAQDLRSFEYTAAIPSTWVQLNFTYGNSTIAATTVIAGRSLMDAMGYYNPSDQLGVSDAFLTLNLSKYFEFPFQVHVGAYTGRYGAMGTYDAGRYGTPLIARTNTIGETITTGRKFGNFFLVLEQGLGGQLGRPPVGLVPAGWNDFASNDVGATFVSQFHLGVEYAKRVRLGLHYITAWTQDDQTSNGTIPDGRITVSAVDLNVTGGRAGHLYFGVARTQLTNASSVSGAIEILNARGGPELICSNSPSRVCTGTEYLGPGSNGTGSLTTFGGQYDLSVSRAVFGDLYTGVSPDLLISLFGVGTRVSSHDPTDDAFKLKGGAEVTYSFLSWMGVSERFDHVRMHGEDSKKAISIVSSRLLMHTGWRSRDEIALQYSYFSYGSDVHPKTGYPAVVDPGTSPDRHVFSLAATFWW